MLKMGRVRLRLDPNPFTNGRFEQRLILNDGYIRFIGNDNTTVNLWVNVFSPVIQVEIDSPHNVALNAYYENWRYEDYQMRSGEQGEPIPKPYKLTIFLNFARQLNRRGASVIAR